MSYSGGSPSYPPPRRSYQDDYRHDSINGGLLALSILATLFCCLPLGVVAIVFTAQRDDERAKPWLIASIVIGIITIGIVVIARSSST